MMQFEFLAAFVGFVALITLYLAYRFLASSNWVMGWIRGNFGLILLLLSGLLILAIIDIRTYRPMFDDVPIATLSLHTLSPDNHQLRLVNHKGIEQSYPVTGNEYQLIVNQFRWATRFSGMGMGHGYRIDHLVTFVGDEKTVHEVTINSSEHLDVWRLFHRYFSQEFFLAATIVKTPPQKVIDGGMYELIPDAFDINIVPLNQVAKEAALLATDSPPVTATELLDVPAPDSEATDISLPAKEPVQTPEGITAPEPQALKQPKAVEIPGAHIEATPAKIIEKPAN